MGALLGASFCAGVSCSELEEFGGQLRKRDFVRPRLGRVGLLSNQGFHDVAKRLIRMECFEDLKIPLTVICTDLDNGQPAAFSSGPLLNPVVGSCLAAGFFDPVLHEEKYLVDGGYTEPVPISYAPIDYVVIAIDAMVRPDWPIGHDRIRRQWMLFNGKLLYLQILKSFDCVLYRLSEEKLRGMQGIHIVPALGQMKFMDFGSGAAAIRAGEAAVLGMLPEIEKAIQG